MPTNSAAATAAQREAATNYARKAVMKTFASSNIQDHAAEFPHFALEELDMGKLLGKGGFGSVFEIRGFEGPSSSSSRKSVSKKKTSIRSNKNSASSLPRQDTSTSTAATSEEDISGHQAAIIIDPNQMESRKFIATHCLRDNGDARYAVKMLSKETVADTGLLIQGMIDMAVETRVLSDIEHPNIVKLRAVAQCDAFYPDYFIVMDRLYDTLESRITKWQKTLNKCTGLGRRFSDPQGVKLQNLQEERLVAAFDLAAAVEYLHNRQILYRDLKPENIGFDIRDDVKIFDFGLAKELHESQRNADGTYNLTEMTGSMRYMAPEVANGQPYHQSCDVYSFAVLLWEMLALKTPYELYTPRSLREKVYNGAHKRPVVPETWNPSVKICLKRSWTADLQARNSMAQIKQILRKEVVRVRKGDDTGLQHDKRRSTFVFRGAQRQSVH